MEKREIKETLVAAKAYVCSLKKLNNDIENAEKQINITASETENSITAAFSNLLKHLTQVLNVRQQELVDKAQKVKNDGLLPLGESRKVITEKIDMASNLINLGESILKHNDLGNINHVNDFSVKSSLLGSLPEVPELKEVPYITFQQDAQTETSLQELCSQYGTVFGIAPMQISQMVEKPGSILVEFQSVDLEDRLTDIQEFRLQRAFGNVITDNRLFTNFTDCYRGLDTQFLVKDLQTGQPYSFRVCCKFEGCQQWSPWSLPQVMCTNVKPFSWMANDDFTFFNENSIAQSVKESPTILFSDGPQFCVGYSVEFILLETDSCPFIIGLIDTDSPNEIRNLKTDPQHSFLVEHSGTVLIDGSEKSTRLPQLKRGMKVSFTCECINSKVRINIDSSDKRITYEWPVLNENKLYFAASFNSLGSKIMVE